MTTDSVEQDDLGIVGSELDGRYRIDRFLGSGTMGSVYEATQLAVGRRVAIKVLNSALKTHREVRERFRLEAQAIASLNHPNCVTLFDFGYSERLGALYMVIEYVEGRSLEDLMYEGLRPSTSLSIAKQIADVLGQAHDAGILHRDLKPENVMILEGADGAPVVKVLDFGLARIFEDAATGARLTRQGQLFGSPAYMSPEQCGGALDVGPEADIYSLGVTMYEMLTGSLPFVTDNVAEVLIMHAKEPAPELVADVDSAVVELVGQMLAKDPSARPTARYVTRALRSQVGDSAPIPASATPARSPRNPAEDSEPPTASATAGSSTESTISAESGDAIDAEERRSLGLAATIPPGLHGGRRTLGIVAVVAACILAVVGVFALVQIDGERSAMASSQTVAPKATWSPRPQGVPGEGEGDAARPAVRTARAVAGTLAVNAGAVASRVGVTNSGAAARTNGVANSTTGGGGAAEEPTSARQRRDTESERNEKAEENENPKRFRKLEFTY